MVRLAKFSVEIRGNGRQILEAGPRRNRQIKMPQFSGVEAEPRGAGAGAAALTATPSQAVHAPHFGQLMAAQG